MAFDGMVVAALTRELDTKLSGGRIYKIAQPEKDELQITIRREKEQFLLLLSAGAGLPLVYLTDERKNGPAVAPNFCMLLRKHIQNGRIVSVTQPGLERVMDFEIEHRDELGDLKSKHLRVEIMGKHSNIIFCDDTDTIIDSIKHVLPQTSSVREVLPGRPYFIPQTTKKLQPENVTREIFYEAMTVQAQPTARGIVQAFTGLSPVMAEEILFRAKTNAGERPFAALSGEEKRRVYEAFAEMLADVTACRFTPCLIYENGEPREFAAFLLTQYADLKTVRADSMSAVLKTYYGEKDAYTRIRQRSADLRHIVHVALERNAKKYDLQRKQLQDTKKKDKYRVYGELLHTYGYAAAPGAKEIEAQDFYSGETVKVPLDPLLTASENAKKYFDRYGKLKRTEEALVPLLAETKAQIDHLESVENALDMARAEADLLQIREELVEAGYIRRRGGTKKQRVISKPLHYLSADGYDIYVGKNNLQNEEITFRLANGGDWWFHAKGVPGSHVIVKTRGVEMSDRVFEEAAALAAHYSKAGKGAHAEVDYLQRKNVKKPNGAKPGFVVYYTNYSMVAPTDISGIRLIAD